MTKKINGYFTALAAGLVLFTACTENSATDRDEQEHIEHLQELDEAQKIFDSYEELNESSQLVPAESSSATSVQRY